MSSHDAINLAMWIGYSLGIITGGILGAVGMLFYIAAPKRR